MPVISIETNISDEWNNTSEKMKSLYGSKSKFLKNLLATGLYRKWVEAIRDTDITASEMNSIAHTMLKYGGFKISDIPRNLAYIISHQNNELPAIEGCLTIPYWEDYFSRNKVAKVA